MTITPSHSFHLTNSSITLQLSFPKHENVWNIAKWKRRKILYLSRESCWCENQIGNWARSRVRLKKSKLFQREEICWEKFRGKYTIFLVHTCAIAAERYWCYKNNNNSSSSNNYGSIRSRILSYIQLSYKLINWLNLLVLSDIARHWHLQMNIRMTIISQCHCHINLQKIKL